MKAAYFEDSLTKAGNAVKKKWKLIRQFWLGNKSNCDIKRINQSTSAPDIANELNTYFGNVGNKLAEKIDAPSEEFQALSKGKIQVKPPSFDFKELSAHDIAILIHDLKPSNSSGVDGLSAKIVKAAGPSIYGVLMHIFNLSLSTSIFPTNRKIGCVTPLFKEGDASDPSNYRPISVLPTLGKLRERVAHTQLYSHFTQHEVITNRQSWFRKGHSMMTCLIDFLDDIYQDVDQGGICGVLFLDHDCLLVMTSC